MWWTHVALEPSGNGGSKHFQLLFLRYFISFFFLNWWPCWIVREDWPTPWFATGGRHQRRNHKKREKEREKEREREGKCCIFSHDPKALSVCLSVSVSINSRRWNNKSLACSHPANSNESTTTVKKNWLNVDGFHIWKPSEAARAALNTLDIQNNRFLHSAVWIFPSFGQGKLWEPIQFITAENIKFYVVKMGLRLAGK